VFQKFTERAPTTTTTTTTTKTTRTARQRYGSTCADDPANGGVRAPPCYRRFFASRIIMPRGAGVRRRRVTSRKIFDRSARAMMMKRCSNGGTRPARGIITVRRTKHAPWKNWETYGGTMSVSRCRLRPPPPRRIVLRKPGEMTRNVIGGSRLE
jgi:hypothetical protein